MKGSIPIFPNSEPNAVPWIWELEPPPLHLERVWGWSREEQRLCPGAVGAELVPAVLHLGWDSPISLVCAPWALLVTGRAPSLGAVAAGAGVI